MSETPPPNPQTNDRRQAVDRRTASDRRRGADGRRVVLEICRSELHLAVVAPEARGDGDVLLCRSQAWRVEAASLLAPGGADELRIAVKQLVVEERLAGAAATVLLNGDLCVNRVSIGSSTNVDREIGELSERVQMYLALGSGEKAAATSRFPLDARHEHAVMSVANRRTVDAVVQAAEGAGLELRAVEASAVALCRAHGGLYEDDTPVVLVQLDENSIELALSHRGRLLLEHRTSGRVTPAMVSEVINQHHGRLVRYCGRQAIEGDLTVALLTGDAALVEAAVRQGDNNGPVSIRNFDAGLAANLWTVRDAPPGTQHAAVLGGAVTAADGGTPLNSPNLLEKWIAESRKHIRPMLLKSAAPIAATLLIAVGLAVTNLELRRENRVLDRQLATLAPDEARANELRLKLLSTRSKIDELSKLHEQTPNTSLVDFMGRVAACLPNDVWLDHLQLIDGRAVAVSGSSYTEGGAYEFVRHLNRAPGMHQAALQETRQSGGSEGPTTAFRIKAGFINDAGEKKPNDPSATASRGPAPAPLPRTASLP